MSAMLAPAGDELEVFYDGTYAHVTVTLMDGHGMLVFR